MTQTQAGMETTRVKLARQSLAAHKARLSTAFDKDSVRRQIAAAEARLREEIVAATRPVTQTH